MFSCEKAIRLASENMDCRLPWWKRTTLQLHVKMCRHCRTYLRQLQYIRDLFSHIVDADIDWRDSPEFSLPADVKARIKQRIQSI